MRADDVYAILKGKLVKLTEDIKSMGDWKPIQHKGTVQTADDLPTDAKEGWMYNIATDSIYGAAGMNVVMTSEGWDPMGSIINMGSYLTKEEGNKTFQPKGNYLSGTDSDLKESGKAADAKVTGEKIAKNSSDITKKLDKNQGVENSGKIAGIDESGDIVPIFPVGVEYNSETNCLEFGSDQKMKLNQGIGLDSTLTKTGSAADAGATGKEINSLKESMTTKITKFYASSQGETHLADSDNGKIMDMVLYGRSEQKQYSGKNLLNATFKTDTYSGVALTNNGDGTYTIEGTNNSSGELIFPLVPTADEQKALYNSLIGKKVKFITESGSTISGSVGRICFVFYNETEKKYSNETHNGGDVAVPTGYDLSVVDIHINVGQTVPKTIIKPMITTDLTATYDDFEPYTGGIPSPNPSYPQEIKSVVNPTVKVRGKNLLELPISNKSTQAGITFEVINNSVIKITGINDGSRVSQYIAYNSQEVKYAKLIPYKNIAITISTYNNDVIAGLAYWLKSENYATVHYKQNKRKCTIDLGEDAKIVPWFFVPQNGIYTNDIVKFGVYYGTDELTYDAPKCHTVTLPYTLNAIPVKSGGNVTIGGQQYVSDYVDVERGKLVRMVDDVEAKNYIWNLYPDGNNMPRRFGMNDTIRFNMSTDTRIMSSHFKQIAVNTRTDLSIWFQLYYIAITDMNEKWKNSEALIQWFSENNVHFYLPLKTSTEIDLTPEEAQALKALATYYPTTNISVNSEQLDGYTVFNYPISMENGWNYVKKQIGDTREYIYDMDARTQDTDLQAAEAYVNSEYAVALTELEV